MLEKTLEKRPSISVLLCVYNGERYIEDSLNSILQQTFTDIECVVINDGSTDRTQKILEEYERRDARIRLVHQKNMGLTKALNVGLQHCHGIWIARQDADDISMPERFAKQMAFVQENPHVGLLGTACALMDAQGVVYERQEVPLFITHEDLCSELNLRNPFVHTSMFFRHDLVKTLGGYSEIYPAAEDYELWFRMSKVTKLAQLAEKLVQRRISSDMICKKNARKQRISVLRIKWEYIAFRDFSLKVAFFALRDLYRIIQG